MGLFDWFARRPSLAEGLETWKSTPGAVLLDVRTPEEYRAGRIPGSRSLPLQELNGVAALAPGKDTPLYLYCHSGVRAGQAAAMLQRMGYTHVKNLGGITAYHGKVER